MNRIELKIELEKLGIPDNIYSLYGQRELGQTVLEWGIKWRVYDVGERGGIYDERYFDTEEEACKYFYDEMYSLKKTLDKLVQQEPYVRQVEEKRTFIASADGDIRVEKEDGESETVNDKQ